MFGIGLGGGSSKSSQSSSSKQSVWGPQGSELGNMYGSAGDLYGQQTGLNPQFQQFMMSQVNPFMMGLNPYMMQGFGGQMGGGFAGGVGQQVAGDLASSLTQSMNSPSNMGKMYQDIVGGPGNTYIDPVVNDMYDSAWRNLDRGAFRQADYKASQGDNMGNYRRQIDNTLLAGETMRNTQQAENALRAGAYDKDLNWKMNIASLADQNIGKAQDRAMGLLGAGDQSQQYGMGAGLGMQQFGMGMANPWMAMQQMPWANMNAYANVLGDPTILGQSKSKGSSSGWNAGVSV